VSLAPDQVLEGDIHLEEDLGAGRGWRARGPEGDALRVVAMLSPPRSPPSDTRVPGELAAQAHGEEWAAIASSGPSLADLLEAGEPLSFEEGLERSLQLLDIATAQAQAGRPPLGLSPMVCFLPKDGSLQLAGQDLELPPEAYEGYRPADQRERWIGTGKAAVYGAGALVHALLTGFPPRAGSPPSAVSEQVPSWLDRVVQMALDPDPNHRYDSLKTFRAALGAARSAIRLRSGEGSTQPAASQVSTSRPEAPHQCGGPSHPLGRRRAGGLPPLPAHAVQAGLPDAPVQDRAGMSDHPEAITPFLPEDGKREPVYRFSWKATLTRGVPIMILGGGVLAWAVTWAVSLVSP
jgi:hypothetical protein